MSTFWEEQSRPPGCAVIDGIEIVAGSRVILRPRPGGDIFDLALAGKVAIVEAVEQDFESTIHLAVTLEDDPGRDLGVGSPATGGWQPGHRFFFALDEVVPLEAEREGL